MTATLPLVIAMLLYLWMSINYIRVPRIGMTVAFIGYSIGNIGLIIDYFETKSDQCA